MNCNICCSPWCWVIRVLVVIAWWLLASGLLLCAWNSVITKFANIRRAKYWHALVIVLTILVLFVPFACRRHVGMNAWHRCGCGKPCCTMQHIPCGQMPCDTMQHK